MRQKEKEDIYKQMTMILTEVQQLMTNYESWKNKLFESPMDEKVSDDPEPKSSFKNELENQNYLIERKNKKVNNDYQTIALNIASILKQSGRPLTTREIYLELIDSGRVLKFSNLSHNIMRKIQDDPSVNVE